MTKFTQEDFDNFPLNENGFKVCPTGDYTDIKVLGEGCSFSESCSFGKRCNFENGQVKNGKYFACDRIGSENRKTYFFIDENKEIFVRAGCFFGTENEFIKKLKETHGITKFEKHYLAALELAKAVLSDD